MKKKGIPFFVDKTGGYTYRDDIIYHYDFTGNVKEYQNDLFTDMEFVAAKNDILYFTTRSNLITLELNNLENPQIIKEYYGFINTDGKNVYYFINRFKDQIGVYNFVSKETSVMDTNRNAYEQENKIYHFVKAENK